MKCTYCGYENGITNDFCSNCGKKLQKSTQNGQMNFNQTASQEGFNMQTGRYGQQPTGGYVNQMNGYRQQPTGGYVNQMNGYRQQPAQNNPSGRMLEKDFYQRFASKGTKTLTIVVIVCCFLTAAIGFTEILTNIDKIKFAMVFSDTVKLLAIISAIEIIYYIVMGILLWVNKKWFLTLIIIIKEVISIIAITIISETFSGKGGLLLIFAIVCSVQLKKIKNSYKIYKSTGNIPERPI